MCFSFIIEILNYIKKIDWDYYEIKDYFINDYYNNNNS